MFFVKFSNISRLWKTLHWISAGFLLQLIYIIRCLSNSPLKGPLSSGKVLLAVKTCWTMVCDGRDHQEYCSQLCNSEWGSRVWMWFFEDLEVRSASDSKCFSCCSYYLAYGKAYHHQFQQFTVIIPSKLLLYFAGNVVLYRKFSETKSWLRSRRLQYYKYVCSSSVPDIDHKSREVIKPYLIFYIRCMQAWLHVKCDMHRVDTVHV